MPLLHSAAPLESTVFINGIETNQPTRFARHEKLGSGLFSDVYRVSDAQNSEYALKVINLRNSNLTEADRVALLGQIKKEAGILKTLGMLKGFKKEKDRVLLLQPYLGKSTALQEIANLREKGNEKGAEKTILDCFATLMKIHEKGIVHLDAHAGNFLHDPKTNARVLIDFGFAQTANKYNKLEDYAQFLLKFNANAANNPNNELSIKLIDFYIESVVEHVKKNKMQLAFKFFAYGVVSIAAIYGLGTFAAAQLLIWAYCKTIALDFLVDWFGSVLERNQAQVTAQKYLNGANDEIGKQFKSSVTQGHIIVSALLFWSLYRSYSSPLNLVEKLFALSAENSALSQAFWAKAFESISLLEIGNAALFYYPATNAYKYLGNLFEATFATENSLTKDCEAIAYSKGWFSYFTGYSSKGENITEDNTKPSNHKKQKPAFV